MSGFELVGVVLGAIPLITAAIKQYRSTMKYKRELKALIRGLNEEHLVLQDTCEKLLVNTVPGSKIEALLKDPFGPLWKDESVNTCIRIRLWRSYNLFEETAEEMKCAVAQLGHKFDLDISAQVQPVPSESGTSNRFAKFNFILRRSQFEGLLKIIENGNTTLTKLLGTSVDREVEVARLSRSRGRYLELSRQSAQDVFEALTASISCPCRKSHDLSLKLSPLDTYPTPADADNEIVGGIIFEVAFASDSADIKIDALPPSWQGLLLQTHTWERKRFLRADALPVTAGATGKQKSIFSRQGAVHHIQSANTNAPKRFQMASTSTIAMELRTLTLEAYPKVANLCDEINRARKGTSQVECYGLITTDSPSLKHTFRVKPRSYFHGLGSWSGQSLTALLVCHSEQPSASMFRFRHKHILASTIASSILKFSGTQWLPDILTSADITFMEQAGRPSFEHPFVTKHREEDRASQQATVNAVSAIPHRLIFSLGIVLLELALGKTIDSMKQSSGHSISTRSRDLLADFEIATQHLDQVERAMGSMYAQAVKSCINCEFMSPNFDLEDEEFRHEVYSKVVALLEKGAQILGAARE